MSSARRLLSMFVAPATCAILAASPGCSSFTEDTSGADSGSEPSTEGGTTTDASQDAQVAQDAQDGGVCAISCPPATTSCISSVIGGGWGAQNDGSDSGLELNAQGELVSSVPTSGAAYFGRMATLDGTRGVVMSLDVTIERLPSNGTTLAKIVAAGGNEVNFRVDDGMLHACGLTQVPCSLMATPLAVGDRVRMTLRLGPANKSGPTPLSLEVNCQPPVATMVPAPGLNLSSVSIHIGLEGAGGARYHEIAIWQPEGP